MTDSKLDSKFSLKSETKVKFIRAFVLIVVVALVWYFIRSTNTHKLADAEPEAVHLGMEQDLLSQDVFKSFEDGLQSQDKVIGDVDRRVKESEQRTIDQEKSVSDIKDELQSMKDLFLNSVQNGTLPTLDNNFELPDLGSNNSFPTPPPLTPRNPPQFSNNQDSNSIDVNFNEEWIGGLTAYAGAPVDRKKTKKKNQKFYMPPSFFGAKLLSGIDAMTNKEALTMPETVMLMVDAPAVLPNHIKKNLQGCYVVANANGNLAKERVQLQVVSLSCLSADGSAVIDEPVIGFTSDIDGKRDLKGNVVARQGSNTALLMVASIIGAIGNQAALSTVTETTNISTGTSTQSFDSSQALTSGLGTGLKDGTKEYKNILIEYIRQSSPVIEVGALKAATVFIQKGVWLNIRDTKEFENDHKG
jgi:conjugal transfer pilus assembly protein TraB